jgi:RNA polymerase sigma-70 factor (ECF subfamily)
MLSLLMTGSPLPAGLTELVASHQAPVLAVALAILGDRALAEDIAQDTFLVAWRKLAAGEQVDRPGPWLVGIARHLALNVRRQRRRLVDDDALATLPATAPGQDDALAAREVRQALAALPERTRVPLVAFYFAGQSVDEVARALGTSQTAVRQQLSRGRKRLGEVMGTRVAAALERGRPGAAFTASVVAAVLAGRASTAVAAAGGKLALGGALGLVALAGATAVVGGLAYRASHGDTRPAVEGPAGATAMRARPSAGHPSEPPVSASLERSISAPPSAARRTLSPPPSPTELARRLDLDVAQIDAQDLLALTAEVSGVPLFVDPRVDGLINLRADDVTAGDMLDEAIAQAGAVKLEVKVARLIPGTSCQPVGLDDRARVTLDVGRVPLDDACALVLERTGVHVVRDGALPHDAVVALHGQGATASELVTALAHAAGAGCEVVTGYEIRPEPEE